MSHETGPGCKRHRARSLVTLDPKPTLRAFFRQFRKAQRWPVITTQNGKPAAVRVTLEEFGRMEEKCRFVEAVREGLADSDAGRLIDDEQLGLELDAEFSSLA